MKFHHFITIVMILVIVIIGCFGCGRKIEQEVKICNDASHFRIYTWVYESGLIHRNYIHVFDTWLENDLSCFEAAKVDSLKLVEYAKAVTFIHDYDSSQKLLK